jgi:hypothetical protein
VIGYAKVIGILEMNNHPIGFFYCDSNNMFKAKTQTSFLSSSYSSQPLSSHSSGFFMSKKNIRKSIVLFSVRSLPKHTWINDNNRFLGRE